MASPLSLKEAVEILELGESFSLEDLQNSYRKLLKKYHPDHCQDLAVFCEEKTREVIEAYKLVFSYVKHYRITVNALESSVPEEFWMKHFASDGVWGNPDFFSHQKKK
ncbi:J domain-containing protein [Thermospira aquatica]|uniref:J domain-containing protein n=1 Tax=Thermospira aquatica TaxID=2828656 RepID=A0AAX3BEV1_9SPIR|nr:J domain-containing protein [Thermospira aquatica]URA10658.1 J domain-containing protein [Thermospira aquatica]